MTAYFPSLPRPLVPTRLAGALGVAGLLLVAGVLLDRLQTQAGLIRQRTEAQADAALAQAGFPWARLQIDNDTGRLLGNAPSDTARMEALRVATRLLAPAIGWPGVFARLEDGQRVSLAYTLRAPQVVPTRVPTMLSPLVAPVVHPVLLPLTPALPASISTGTHDAPLTAAECRDALTRAQGAERVLFDSGAVQPTAASLRLLDRLAPLAHACPGATLNVQGHTDVLGDADQNLRLSLRRAEAVVAALAARGMAAAQLSAEGLGASRPLDGAATAQAHMHNRRIEFHWVFASR